ncbi:WW domain-containing protein [Plasmodiophora brassicae]|uniref:WW domain-containing protein n=1 Tax=Plasmodiophora brassicae TaxID=37360 RepID=A0A0G4IK16_PLABS|nr:hypothetical protein PBRA_004255 [Plasmodiophora brassicae]SPR00403.1 unnamed protein product [Plasmodiophora brassicae]
MPGATVPAVGSGSSSSSFWVRVLDKRSGKYYYWDKVTNKTVWKEPPGYAAQQASPNPTPTLAPRPAADSRQAVPSRPGPSKTAPPAVTAPPVDRSPPNTCPVAASYDGTSRRPSSAGPFPLRDCSIRAGPAAVDPDTSGDAIGDAKAPQQDGAVEQAGEVEQGFDLEAGDVVPPDTSVPVVVLHPATTSTPASSFRSSTSLLQSLKFAKHRSNVVQRVLRIGGILTEDQLMSFQKTPIRKALLKQNRQLDAEVMQGCKNIQSYMEDRASSKLPVYHAQKLLKAALAGDCHFRDELYLLVCKQIHNNPNDYHTLRGWDLILIFLAAFPPGPFSLVYLKKRIEAATSAEILRRASAVADRIPQICRLGPRRNTPSLAEISSIPRFKQLDIVVTFLDRSTRIFQVDSYTTVREFRRQIGMKCNLTVASPFNLYAVSATGQRSALDGDRCVLDLLVALCGSDVPASADAPFCMGGMRIEYRCEIVLPIDRTEIASDLTAVHLMYSQAVEDMRTMPKMHSIDQAVDMAAFQLQATYGDAKRDMHTPSWVSVRIREILPECIVRGLSSHLAEIERVASAISAGYLALNGTSPHAAKVAFIRAAESLPLYGSTVFDVQYGAKARLLAILHVASSGVYLMDRTSKEVVEAMPWATIESHGNTDDRLVLSVKRNAKASITIMHPKAAHISKLIGDYRAAIANGLRAIY